MSIPFSEEIESFLMETGPFVKDHALFTLIRSMDEAKPCLGFTYERCDRYAGIWFPTEADAQTFRAALNSQIGWSIASKPDLLSAESDLNPFTVPVACISPVPKDIADRNDKYGGDAMVGALSACMEAGIEVRL